MKSLNVQVKKRDGREYRERKEKKGNKWPISIKVAMLLKVGAGQLKLNSRRMDWTD